MVYIDDFIVFSPLLCHNAQELNRNVRQARSKIKSRKPLHELKFYTASTRSRHLLLRHISACDIRIYALVIDKKELSIADTPYHYALLCSLLLKELPVSDETSYIFDKHFHRPIDQNAFNTVLQAELGYEISIVHADSKEEYGIQAADMVAGAILQAIRKKDTSYQQDITPILQHIKRIKWKEVKQKKFA